MKNQSAISLLFTFLLLSGIQSENIFAQQSMESLSPEKYFGFKPGADRMLFEYKDLVDYLKILDESSPKIKLEKIGESPLGRDMYIAFISAPENISNLGRLKEINKELALDDKLSRASSETLIAEGKVFLLATLSMHSGEVGPSQSAPIIAYDLLTTEDKDKLDWMKNVVYMMVPCHNPDGMDMVVKHYNKYKGTKFEGTSLPGVYHKYVGHDNNRDFVTLSQEDTKAIARIYNLDWFPQVMVEKHQMGYSGPRYFVPPNHDPIAENIDAGIWNWSGIFGANQIKDMTGEGLAGISQHYAFDDYWPGSTETCIWKNVIGTLTECASANYASPIFVEPSELSVYGKGLSEYKKGTNMPLPWPGGWWRLSDIVDYEITSTMSILKTASTNRKEILQFRNDLCKREVDRGKTIPPFYYILPLNQHDKGELVDAVELMIEHGIYVYELVSPITLDGRIFEKGDIVVPLAQPFRAFIKEILEKQSYPLRHYTPDGEIIKPYDITSWSIPLHRGLSSFEIVNRSESLEQSIKKIEENYSISEDVPSSYQTVILSSAYNESYKIAFKALSEGLMVYRSQNELKVNNEKVPPGSFIINKDNKLTDLLKNAKTAPIFSSEINQNELSPLSLPRIGLVESYFHDMDAGWTRFVFDSYSIPYSIIRPGEFSDKKLGGEFDVIIFPSEDKSILTEGKRKSGDSYYVTNYPPEFTKGMGEEGLNNLLNFLQSGGNIISWGSSTKLFAGPLKIKSDKTISEEFQLPFRDDSEKLQKEGLYVAGALVQINLLENNPITYGMKNSAGVFYRGEPVFATSIPSFDMDRRVIGIFPEEDILLSGYGEKIEKIGNKAGLIWIKKGKGQLVLMAFNPQFRASTQGTYKLLFNSLLLGKLD